MEDINIKLLALEKAVNDLGDFGPLSGQATRELVARLQNAAQAMLDHTDKALAADLQNNIVPLLAERGFPQLAGLLVSGPTADDEVH